MPDFFELADWLRSERGESHIEVRCEGDGYRISFHWHGGGLDCLYKVGDPPNFFDPVKRLIRDA